MFSLKLKGAYANVGGYYYIFLIYNIKLITASTI